jgi:hypothetical protein
MWTADKPEVLTGKWFASGISSGVVAYDERRSESRPLRFHFMLA